MRKALSALGIAVSAAVPVAVPSSLEALMIVPCLNEVREVWIEQDYKLVEVKKGDTLWGISKRKYGTPWAYGALAITNDIKNPDNIKEGRYLRIYTGEPASVYVRDRWLGGSPEALCPITENFSRQKIVYVD